jgi:hypothetical protein
MRRSIAEGMTEVLEAIPISMSVVDSSPCYRLPLRVLVDCC